MTITPAPTKTKRRAPLWLVVVLAILVLILLIAVAGTAGSKAGEVAVADQSAAQADVVDDTPFTQADIDDAVLEAELAADARIAVCQADIAVISNAGAEMGGATADMIDSVLNVLTYGATDADVAAITAVNERIVAASDSLDNVQGCE